jgi:hypothetical protein
MKCEEYLELSKVNVFSCKPRDLMGNKSNKK